MGELAALLAAFLWSATSTLLAGLVVRLSPVGLSTLRLTLALPLYLLLVMVTGDWRDVSEASAATLFAMTASGALAFGVGDTLYIYGLMRLGITRTFPVTQSLFTLFTFLGAVLLLDEVIDWQTAVGSALILAGVYLVITGKRTVAEPLDPLAEPVGSGRPVLGGGPESALYGWFSSVAGWIAVIVAAISWAGATVWLRGGSGDLSAIAAGSLRVPAGALVLWALVIPLYGAGVIRPLLQPRRFGAVLAVAWMGSVIGGTLYIYSVQEAGAAKAAILSATAPLLALPLAFFFLKERPSGKVLFGTAVSVAGVILVV